MPHHPGTPQGGPADVATDSQLMGEGNKCMPCEGELRSSFQGRPWSDPGGGLLVKLFNIIINAVVHERGTKV